jgi:hypothetical protein
MVQKLMNKKRLEDLKGLPIEDAIYVSKLEGWKIEIYPFDARITAVLKNQTLIVFHESGIVRKATVGNPSDLQEFVNGEFTTEVDGD